MVTQVDTGLHAPTKIPKDIKMVKEEAAPSAGVAGMYGMGGGTGGTMGALFGSGAGGPKVVAKPTPPKGPTRVSGGVISGSKIAGADPIYPPIAKAAHVQGTVVLHALISKTGSIEDLTVISGPQMLQNAALEAVKTWRYRPYMLGSEPTEVDTTITVNFTMNGG
jgi:protein TonB